jgi:hypothetical protein
MEKHPLDAALSGGRNTMFTWSVNLHNAVNRSLGKAEMSVQDAMTHWTSVLHGTPQKTAPYAQTAGKHCTKQSLILKMIFMILMLIICGIIIGLLLSDFFNR